MKGKWPLSFVLILLVACSAWAQDEGETEIMRNLMNSIARTGLSDAVPYYSVSNREEAKVEGSVLLDQEWKEGRVLKANGELYRIVGRYNTQADEIQIKVGDDIRAIYPDRVRAAAVSCSAAAARSCETTSRAVVGSSVTSPRVAMIRVAIRTLGRISTGPGAEPFRSARARCQCGLPRRRRGSATVRLRSSGALPGVRTRPDRSAGHLRRPAPDRRAAPTTRRNAARRSSTRGAG